MQWDRNTFARLIDSMRHIVLDTNCLLQCISERSRYYNIWHSFVNEEYTLCVTTEILEEYEEIIARKMSPLAGKLVVETILRANNVLRVDAQFRFNMIEADVDDNKFVDCAIVANAEFIVSDDSHFDILKRISFPKVYVKKIHEFFTEICANSTCQ